MKQIPLAMLGFTVSIALAVSGTLFLLDAFVRQPIAAQVMPECPKGLAEAAAQKKYDYDQSQAEQAAFQAMRKGPR